MIFELQGGHAGGHEGGHADGHPVGHAGARSDLKKQFSLILVHFLEIFV